MRAAERGFLLLGSYLGDPSRKPLTVAQLRKLAQMVRNFQSEDKDRDLEPTDLIALGCGRELACHIVDLLADDELLDYYLEKGKRADCVPICRASEDYPLLLRKRLGLDSPGCLWLKGDKSFLKQPAVALVGSRDLMENNRVFAAEVGKQAALQGYVLVSGNARGADRTAQESCLAHGGQVISVVSDELRKQRLCQNVLYVSEDGFAEPFSSQRALSRNRIIHALGLKTFVAQSSLKMGGTWDGTVKNLRAGWSDVYCFDDGSEATAILEQMGANLVGMKDLVSFYDLPDSQQQMIEI